MSAIKEGDLVMVIAGACEHTQRDIGKVERVARYLKVDGWHCGECRANGPA